MRRRSTTWFAFALLAVSLCASAGTALAQASPPFRATIFFKDPPPGAIYDPTTKITVIVQVQATAPILTTEEFPRKDFRSFLVVMGPNGDVAIPAEAAHLHRDIARLFNCLTRNGVTQHPALSVTPAVVLSPPPAAFFLEFVVDDLRTLVDLKPGRSQVSLRVPLIVFSGFVTDCDGIAPDVADLGAAEALTIVSNTLELVESPTAFFGFAAPLVNDTECAALPCRTFSVGTTIPVKFREDTGAQTTCAARLVATQVSGALPLQSPQDFGRFRFEGTPGNCIVNADTSPQRAGVWRFDAIFDDGTIRSVHYGLR